MKQTVITIAAAGALLLTAACDSRHGWGISGEVTGAAGDTLVIEGFNNGLWYAVDNVVTKDNGSFSYQSAQPAAYPEVMRISLGDRSIYFPVDSADRITLSTTADDFGTRYTLAGSPSATIMASLDSVINASVAARGAGATLADNDLKKQLFRQAYNDPTVISYYYLANKSVDGKPLLNLTNPKDLYHFRTAAQRFVTARPDDPRTEWFKALVARAHADNAETNVTEITVPSTGLFDIVRDDEKGQRQSLAEMASKGNVTVLSFTDYTLESSPAYNALLNAAYERYGKSGLQIYQLAFDADETRWRQTAVNLPWTTVWNTTTGDVRPLTDYNVGALPTTFIIDREGAIAARVTDPTKLETELAKYI